MYRLLHWVFGWDYIAWRNSSDQGVARVHLDNNGTCYYWRYRQTAVADRVLSSEQVLWLTCPPSKYLNFTTRQARSTP